MGGDWACGDWAYNKAISVELRTFGGLAIRAESGPLEGAGSQKRRLALLALVDASGDRGISRDKLLGLLWAESAGEKARGALAQALYSLRKSLGSEELFLGANELQLNRDVLDSDRSRFLADLAKGALESAVAHYSGPYLDGFFLTEAPEFEMFVDAERASLAHKYVAALQSLAADAASRNDTLAAVGWWRKLVVVDPLNGQLTLGLMRAMSAAGDRAGAIQHARLYERLLQQELDVPADSAVQLLAEELKRPAPELRSPREPSTATPSSAPHNATTNTPADPQQGTPHALRSLAEQLTTSEVVAVAMHRLKSSRTAHDSYAGIDRAREQGRIGDASPGQTQSPTLMTGASDAAVAVVRKRMPAKLGFGAVALVMIGVAAIIVARRTPATLVMGSVTQVTRSTDTLNFDAAISPDGKFVAYATGVAGRMRLFVRQVSGSAPVPIVTGFSGDQRWPRWSPDGSRLAFVANNAIYVIPVLGGTPQLVVTIGDIGGQPAWAPDGVRLAYADSGGISVVAITGGSPRRVAHTIEAHSPAWSPDGHRVAYAVENQVFTQSAGYGNAAPSSIWTVSATGGDSALVTDAAHLNTAPVWWPDGGSILFVSDRDGPRDVYRQAVNMNGRPRGNPDRVTSGLNVFTFTLSRDGSAMAYSTLLLRANIWMAPISANGLTPSSAARPVTTEKQSIEGIALSHDGKWLAYDSNRNGNLDIFKIAFNGSGVEGDAVALSTDSAPDFEPRWSPHDDQVVFYSRRFGSRDVFTVKADGRGESRVTDLPGNEYYPEWSPDGQRIVFSSQVSFGWDVFVTTRGASAAWSVPQRIDSMAQNAVNVRWSPDGRFLAVVHDSTLGLLPAEGGVFTPLVDAKPLGETITFVVWGRTPALIYFQTRDRSGISTFWSTSTTGGPPRRLLRLAEAGRRTRRPEFDTDGKNLFFTVVADEADVAVVRLRQAER